MKPIRGPIDYGGYPSRKKRAERDARNAQRDSRAADALTPEQIAAHQAEQAERERAQRLQSRAQSFRQASHDAHGFPTHGHVLLPHEEKTDEDNLVQENEETPTRAVSSRQQLKQKTLQQKAETYAARRDRNNPNWKRVRKLTKIAACVLALQIVGLALTQPEMNIRRVRIVGAQLTPNRVLEGLQTRLVGQNILRARTAEATKTLRALPFVKSAQVSRGLTWPPQLTISVVERAPFIRVGNDKIWLVADENGVPFRAVSKDDDKLEAIYNASWNPTLGQKLGASEWKRATDFVELLQRQRAAGKGWKLRRVYFDRHGFVSLRLTGGFHDETLVQLGGDEWPQKLRRARQSLDYLETSRRRASELNLITYAMPVWTMRAPIAPPTVRNG